MNQFGNANVHVDELSKYFQGEGPTVALYETILNRSLEKGIYKVHD